MADIIFTYALFADAILVMAFGIVGAFSIVTGRGLPEFFENIGPAAFVLALASTGAAGLLWVAHHVSIGG